MPLLGEKGASCFGSKQVLRSCLLRLGEAIVRPERIQTLTDGAAPPLANIDDDSTVLAVTLHDTLITVLDHLIQQLGKLVLQLVEGDLDTHLSILIGRIRMTNQCYQRRRQKSTHRLPLFTSADGSTVLDQVDVQPMAQVRRNQVGEVGLQRLVVAAFQRKAELAIGAQPGEHAAHVGVGREDLPAERVQHMQ